VTGTAAIGIAGDCPNTVVVEVDVDVLKVGYRPYGTLVEHH
jgi:hypothetical protein